MIKLIKPLIILSLLLPLVSVAHENHKLESRPIRFSNDNEELGMQVKTQAEELDFLRLKIASLEQKMDLLIEKPTNIAPEGQSPEGQSNLVVVNKTPSITPSNVQASTQTNDDADDIFNVSKNQTAKNEGKPPVNSAQNTDKKLYDTALLSYKAGNNEDAETKFTNLLKNYPKSPLGSNAYFWCGEIFLKQKMYEKAAINYLKGYKTFPKGAKAADSLLKLAVTLGELKKNNEACSMLSKLEAEFPSRPSASVKRVNDIKQKYNCKNR